MTVNMTQKNRTELCGQIAELCETDLIIANILVSRGISTPDAAKSFLYSNDKLFHNPFLLQDMKRAVCRVELAIKKNEKILIVGDSDTDGITATTCLLHYLRSLGATADFHIPDNGDNNCVWEEDPSAGFAEQYRLIITVDTGISAGGGISLFRKSGVDVIVTDHHECKSTLPDCYAVINPKRRDSEYPFGCLSGAGVALKLIYALAMSRGNAREVFWRYCDLVAIGTVADAMPLVDENRFIVKSGLEVINKKKRVSLDVLLRTAGYNFDRPVTASSTGFVVAPRLNAAGRIGRADLAVELLMCENFCDAKKMAEQLAVANRERQQLEVVAVKEATLLVDSEVNLDKDRIIILKVDNWQQGIPGIVASRLMDRYALTCIIVSFTDGVGRGSARSIKGFDIYDAISRNKHLLLEYGGHELAAGFAVLEENFEMLAADLKRQAHDVYEAHGFENNVLVEAELEVDKMTIDFAGQVSKLEPFGAGNSQPVFLAKNMEIEDIISLANNRHLKLSLLKDDKVFTGLIFGHTANELKCTAGDIVDIAFALDINISKGANILQLIIKKVDIASNCLCEGYEQEYYDFIDGKIDILPSEATPDRSDVIDVYSYLLRTANGSDANCQCNPAALARTISRCYNRKMNFAKLILSLDILRELNMADYQLQGKHIVVSAKCLAHKTNLADSALWKKIRG